MASNKEAQRRQRRRELDARRSKFRVRLGSWPESWSKMKDQLGFSLHSELAQFLLDSHSCKVCSRCSDDEKEFLSVSMASLDLLIRLIHSHAQQCPLTPNLQSRYRHRQEVKPSPLEEDPETSTVSSEVAEPELCFTYVCEDGHTLTWRPVHTGLKSARGSVAPSRKRRITERRRGGVIREEVSRTSERGKAVCDGPSDGNERVPQSPSGENDEESLSVSDAVQHEQDVRSEEGSDEALLIVPPVFSTRVRENTGDDPETSSSEDLRRRRMRSKTTSQRPENEQPVRVRSRRNRKPTPKLILPCEFDGCWKIFSSRQYLNYHMKYQHFHQKTFTCSEPSCGKSFNFKKHLKEHEKLHRDQRDYICEFCARAFRTSSNLSIHRRIHTGEKPLQCEVCGFTCRQKASLNWHMRKHDAERTYQFECEICGRRFEKRDNVTAHQSKSHPDHMTSDLVPT